MITPKEYVEFLKESNFNEKQIKIIVDVRKQWDAFEKEQGYVGNEDYCFLVDSFERDLWDTFNRSGLFEDNDEENLSGIYNWGQEDTRCYITEVELTPSIVERVYPI